jgi:hypothetical protein
MRKGQYGIWINDIGNVPDLGMYDISSANSSFDQIFEREG